MTTAVGQVIGGRFLLERFAGRGAMAQVYAARDLDQDEVVAVKLLDDVSHKGSRAGRFGREVGLLARLSHPAIVRYIAHGVEPSGQRWLAMEWLDGEALGPRLARGPLALDDALSLAASVAEALAVAHREGVVHRDIKPDNLMLVDRDPRAVKVLDFGIALEAEGVALTRTGFIVGTPAYMAPEQARALPDVDARADVFALGAVLYECLTGRRAFDGQSATAVLGRILFDRSTPIRELRPDLPRVVGALVDRLLERDRDRRPADGAVAAELLRAAAETLASAGLVTATGEPHARVGLSDSEQRVVCVIATAHGGTHPGVDPGAPTVTSSDIAGDLPALLDVLGAHDVHVEVLGDGTVLGVVSGPELPAELAMRAARCALALRRRLRDQPVVVATGLGVVGGDGSASVPVGEAMDRAVEQMARPPREGVAVDSVTAGLLDARFDVDVTEAGAPWLVAERPQVAVSRTFLGARSRFLGRSAELAMLEALYRSCVDDREPCAAVVTAPAGVGKSRLAAELLDRIRASDAAEPTVWIARGDPLTTQRTYGMLGATLRALAGIEPGDSPSRQQRRMDRLVGRRLPESRRHEVAAFVGEVAEVRFDDASVPALRAARADGGAAVRAAIRASFAAWLAAEAEARPLLLVLEDLHWGDASTLELVARTLDRLTERPVMVLACARPAARDRFGRVWDDLGATEIRLGGLSRRDALRLVRSALGSGIEPGRADGLVEQAEGNVFYLQELLRAATDERTPDVPESVLGMVQVRLDALEPDPRRVLRAASVFGNAFAREEVEALVPERLRGDALRHWLSELCAGEILRRDRTGEAPSFVFHHALLRDAAYRSLTASDRALGHALAGALHAARPDPDAVLVATHYERAGERDEALRWYRRAAELAVARDDNRQTLDLVAAAQALEPEGEVRGVLLELSSACHGKAGDLQGVRMCSEEAATLLPEGSPYWLKTVGRLSLCLVQLGDVAGCRSWTERLVAAAVSGTAAVGVKVEELCRATSALVLVGDYDTAERLLAAAELLMHSLPDPPALTSARLALAVGIVDSHRARHEAALERHAQAASHYTRAGSRYGVCIATMLCGHAQRALERWDAAAGTLEDAIALARTCGTRYGEVGAMSALAVVQARRRDPAAAETARAAVELAESVGNPVALSDALANHGWVRLAAGDAAGALASGLRALELVPDAPPARLHAQAVIATAHLDLGSADAAAAVLGPALEALDALGGTCRDGDGALRDAARRLALAQDAQDPHDVAHVVEGPVVGPDER